MAGGETVVGSILGYLRLDADQFNREIAKAIAAAKALDGQRVDVKITTTGGDEAIKTDDEVVKANDRVVKSNERVGRSGSDAGRGMRPLTTAILTVGPALVPLAAGAAGVAVGFGAMGAAGVLAVVGISQAMKSGSAMGREYTANIGRLKSSLSVLAATAASGVLMPFADTVRLLQSRMPALNAIVRDFSVIAGRSAAALTAGLLSAFIALAPLARQVGVAVLNMSTRFAALMAGPGVKSFGDYVRSVFPQVMSAVAAIAGAAVNLVRAFAPLGLGALGALRAFSGLISAIPIGVLTQLASVAGSVVLGFYAFRGLTAPLAALAGRLRAVGVAATTTAAAVRVLTIAAGVIGVALAAASFLYSRFSESARQASASVNGYTDALRQSNGVLDSNIRLMTFKSLQDSGAIATARNLGYNLADVTSAAMGNTDALARVNAQTAAVRASMAEAASSGADLGATYGNMGGDINKVSTAISGNNAELVTARQKWQDQQAAMAVATFASASQYRVQQRLASGLGMTTNALATAQAAQLKTAQTAQDAMRAMQLENDAAGILKTTLDALNGKALSAADAQNAWDSSLIATRTSLAKTSKGADAGARSLQGLSASAVGMRGQLNSAVRNLMAVVEANGGLSNSTSKARGQMAKMRDQLIDAAVAAGYSRKQVTTYIDQLLRTPKSLPPTKFDVNTILAKAKIASLQGAVNTVAKARQIYISERGSVPAKLRIMQLQDTIDRLRNRTVTVTARISQVATGKFAGKALPAFADGGIVAAGPAVARRFADGGITENRVAQIAPAGAMRLWAEPETGGEAYIPLAPAKRARSVAIWAETGNRLGVGTGQGGPMRIEGTLDLGGGLTGIVRGVVRQEQQTLARQVASGRR